MKHIFDFLTNGGRPGREVRALSLRLVLLAILTSCTILVRGEGSTDFTGYPGYRMFLDSRYEQQLKVFAKAGEFINVGASHVGIAGGFIKVYRPDGTLAVTIDGNGAPGKAVIHSNTEEAAGPTGGGTTQGAGYVPSVMQVPAGQTGVWTVYIGFPTYSTANFTNLLNNAPWTRAVHQPIIPSVILAWDITVTLGAAGNDGGTVRKGRVFTNEFISVINQNGFTTSPKMYLLTKGGFLYKVDFKEIDPFRFPFSTAAYGMVFGNFNATYHSYLRESVIRSVDTSTWAPGQVYLYEPQAEDILSAGLINNKIFLNLPDNTMPATALVTDIFRNNTHTTWLLNHPYPFKPDLKVVSIKGGAPNGEPCYSNSVQTGIGAVIKFSSSQGGVAVLSLDLNNDGDFTDPIDRKLSKTVGIGLDSIFWDGKDGLGNLIPASMNFTFPYRLDLTDGETHVVLSDIENNLGGVTFTLLSTVPATAINEFYYDHSLVGGGVSGGGLANYPLPTTTPYTYQNNYGDNLMLDYWIYVIYQGGDVGVFNINLVDDCTEIFGLDSDGDGVNDIVDIDDDNDGVPDKKEYCNPGGGFGCLPGGRDPSHDEDADGVPNYRDANDPAVSNGCTDANNDGICDAINPVYDTDRDGVPDHLDLDSDNDGITDLAEAGHMQPDANGDGVIDGLPAIFGLNGLYNPIASNPNALSAVETYVRWDTDSDGVPDHDDLDSDNDGINDVAEAGYAASDSNDDGRIDNGNGNPPPVNAKGLAPVIDPAITLAPIPNPPDRDGDGVPDFHDLDSDNDLITDVEEGGNRDADNDAIIGTGVPVVDVNGKTIAHAAVYPIATTSRPLDTDFDQKPDYIDLDADNDGINDVKEAGGNDPDNNALPGTGTPNVDTRGRPTGDNSGAVFQTTSLPVDSDGDAVRNYRDLDSDNDGIHDVAEASKPDPDGDGITGFGVPVVDARGKATADQQGNPLSTTSLPDDTETDGTPDYLDLDTDGDVISDVIEAGNPDPDNDNIIGTGVPVVDQNGLATADQNNAPLSTTSNPPDTDTDGLSDWRDLDSDGDNLADSDECPNDHPCIDGDGDGLPDFQDPDRDNDGLPDGYECIGGVPCTDTDGDGVPDVDDLDSDGDGLTDMEECTTAPNCPDSNNDGIPNWQQYTCHAGTVVAQIQGLSGSTIVCEGTTVTLTGNNNIQLPDMVTYTWTGPNNFTFNGSAQPEGPFPVTLPGIAPANVGIYTLQIFTIHGCPSQPATVPVQINAAPPMPQLAISDDTPCQNSAVQLSTTPYAGSNVQYNWFFDNGSGPGPLASTAVSNYQIGNVTQSNNGSYMVQVFANGCPSPVSAVQTLQVNNQQNQAPALSISDDVLCEGENLGLASSNYPGAASVQYEWFFNNGANAISLGTTNAPAFTVMNVNPSSTGSYSVVATVDGCVTPSSGVETVLVGSQLSQPSLTVSNAVLCEGETLELTATSYPGSSVTWLWMFNGPGGPSSLGTTSVPTLLINGVTPANSGNYIVIASSTGCPPQSSSIQNVTVNGAVGQAPALTVSDNVLCESETLQLNSSVYPGGNVQYQWYFDNGNGPALLGVTSIPTFFINGVGSLNSGIYTVRVLSSDCASPASNAENVQVSNTLSQAPALSVNFNVLCEGETLQLNSNAFQGQTVQYQWFFNNGSANTSLGTTLIPTFFVNNVTSLNSGIYTVQVTVSGCTSQPSNAQDVDINNSLNQAPSLSVSASVLCQGETLELNSSTYPGSNVQYQWYFDNGAGPVLLATTNLPTYFIQNTGAANDGIYTVVAMTGNCVTQPSNAQNVTISNSLNQAPALSISASILCEGQTLELNSTAISGSNVQYQWFFNDGTGSVSIGITNLPTLFIQNVNSLNEGIYTVVAMSGNCVSQPSNAQDVTINNGIGPATSLTVSDTGLCPGETLQLNSSIFPGINVQYRWIFNGGNGPVVIGTTNNPTFFVPNVNANNAGIYTVVVLSGNCSTQPSNAISVAVTNMTGPAPTLSVSATTLCEGATLTLNSTAYPGNNITYQWYFDNGNGIVALETTTVPTLFIQNMTTAKNGIYSVVAISGSCFTSLSNQQMVNVASMATVTATNPTSANSPACADGVVQLSVEEIAGATYKWSGPSGFTANVSNPVLVNPTPAMAGNYTVSVQMNGCNLTTAPTTVYVFDQIVAKDDNFETPFNKVLENINPALNDLPGNVQQWTITIVEGPQHGQVTENGGLFTYRPNQNFFGEDRFVYEICNLYCPDDCSTAIVKVRVRDTDETETCFVPNIITPNGDGANDYFTVPCLSETYANNSVKIFNRWGDQVFQAKPYKNNWDGTFKGNALPPGTYFYLIQLDANTSEECLQGYFTITR